LFQAILAGADRAMDDGWRDGFWEEVGQRLWLSLAWWVQLPAYFVTVLISARRVRTTAGRWGTALLATGVYLVVGMVAIGLVAGPDGATALTWMLWFSVLVTFDAEFALIAAAVALLVARYDKRARYR
jgi:hypothetical protein